MDTLQKQSNITFSTCWEFKLDKPAPAPISGGYIYETITNGTLQEQYRRAADQAGRHWLHTRKFHLHALYLNQTPANKLAGQEEAIETAKRFLRGEIE